MLTDLKCYFQASPSNACCVEWLRIDDWYCKPSILRSLARCMGCLFISAPSIYQCQQFTPSKLEDEKLYKVKSVYYLLLDPKDSKKTIVPEFTSIHEDLYEKV